MNYTVNLADISLLSINSVGGKNASIGELIRNLSHLGVKVPGGFATLVSAYRDFLSKQNLDKKIDQILQTIQVEKIDQLNKASAKIRRLIINTPFTSAFENEVSNTYAKLHHPTVAVRSSATAEDLPNASFAGQQETYLNVKGSKNVLQAIKLVFASLFSDRAITYRHHHGFDQLEIGISVGIQPMIRSDQGTSGVIFTLDTESGFDQVILITASYGLGEGIVQGGVIPDEFYVSKPILESGKFSILQRKLGEKNIKMIYTQSKSPHQSTKIVPVSSTDKQKFCISDKDIQLLGRQALMIEKHYGKCMDIEWAKDGLTGEIYILQARPETVKSLQKKDHILEQFKLSKRGKVLITGQSVGQRIGNGRACVINHPKFIDKVKPGSVLVTDMTDPDWEPVMKQAAAIVTNRGGRTCHAAIVAREFGIPAVVGCGNATRVIQNNSKITVSCSEGQTGYVYEGNLPFKINKLNIKGLPPLPLKLCLNVGNPGKAFSTQFLPNDGVGLARLEFIINHMIGIHPNALLQFTSLPKKIQKNICAKIASYQTPTEFYVEKLREGIATIAAAFYPKEVIFRFSDFKSNEYANLLGGEFFEPQEENPMLGFRGASRYISRQFKACFKMECEAIKRARDKMGLTNAQVMIPFVRTVDELKKSIKLIEGFGLRRGLNGLKIYMMCELPSNIILANEFLEYVDGYSIGSNDLTQLILGLDRDSNLVASSFDERNDAVKAMLHEVITTCNIKHKYIGICGQGPSDHPDFARWLLNEKIQCISLNPDSIIDTWLRIAKESNDQHKETNLIGFLPKIKAVY